MAKRKKKKQSNNGVWIGMGISGVITSIIVIALAASSGSDPADNLSGKITESTLAKQTLKTDGLPNLGNAPGGSGSLQALLSEAQASKNMITAGGDFGGEKQAKAEQVIQALHGAAASTLAQGSLDGKIPAKYFDSPEVKSQFGTVGRAISLVNNEYLEAAEFDQAQDVALSYFQLGQKIFASNKRLKSRQRGLAIMKSALSTMGRINKARFDDGEIDQDAMRALNDKVMEWNSAIKDFEDVWNKKLNTTESVNQKKGIPNTADIIKIAREDKDPTFRIWAALRLGYALFERGGKGNQEALKAAIEELKNDSDKQVSKAAAEGESIADSDEYYELRK
ncbi:MAG: hypothetical protein AAGB26_00140 [Planctomycetota bacterium]